MSSEFSPYFEEFLKDDLNDFDIFYSEFNTNESEGQYHHSGDLQLQGSAPNNPKPTLAEDSRNPCLATNGADTPLQIQSAPWTLDAASTEMLLPEPDVTGNRRNGDESGVTGSTQGRLGNMGSPINALPSSCPWTSCSTSLAAATEAQSNTHLQWHWAETLRQWSGPRKCDWPNCRSKATFKSPGSLKSHIFNIHVNPLVCTEPQCVYTKPFSSNYDLKRHNSTIHGTALNHTCPVESCDAHTTGFSRKDKLLNHMREQHDNLKCPYNHCFATVLDTQQEQHLQQFHGSFECALGACATGPASGFLKIDFQRHLRKHHNLTYDPAENLARRVDEIEDHTARPCHIVRLRAWQDCPMCSTRSSAEGVLQNE